MTRATLTSPDLRGTFPSLVVSRNLFPYVAKIFNPKVLKFMGKVIPWRPLNRLIELTETMHANARDIYETKKRLLESGDSATVKQVGDGKDIISLLSTSIEPYFTTAGLTYTEVQANAVASEEGQLSEEELLAQMT